MHSNTLIQAIQRRAWLLFTAVIFISSLPAFAQHNSTESPYTRFGFGAISPQGLAANRAMGGVGYGMRLKSSANPTNPASYSAVDSMTFIFDMGASTGGTWYKEGQSKNFRMLGNFEYATMLFPLTKHMGMSVGLLPVSSAGYQFGSVQPIEGQEGSEEPVSYSRLYSGRGNLSEAYIGLAGRPFKNFSVGLNLGYIFGRFNHSRTVKYGSSTAYTPVLVQDLNLQGFRPEVGLQYTVGLKGGRNLTIGAVYSVQTSFWSKHMVTQMQTSGGSISEIESSEEKNGSGLYRLPNTFGLGVSWDATNKLLLAADVEYSRWKDARFDLSETQMQDQWRVALAGQWLPDVVGRGFFKTIGYRFGVHAQNSYLLLPTVDGRKGYYEAGASVGLNIPLVDRRSTMHLSLEYGLLLPTSKQMIYEQSFRLTLGFSFNEGWFRKLQIN